MERRFGCGVRCMELPSVLSFQFESPDLSPAFDPRSIIYCEWRVAILRLLTINTHFCIFFERKLKVCYVIPFEQGWFFNDLQMIPIILAEGQVEFLYVWSEARPEGKAIIVVLVVFSIFAWSVMAAKSMQIRRARKLNRLFDQEFRQQKSLVDIFKRNIQVEGCPLYTIYAMGNRELSDCQRHHSEKGGKDEGMISLKSMEHVKRALERGVAQESLRLESGLILLAIAVSGAPFLGLLGTVWGVMSVFASVASQQNAQLTTIAPGVAGALVTTVAGLLVAIPSMFGYNWLVHNIRVLSVEMDNFAQELASKMETEFIPDE